ncbi:SUMF1/EgtB/PvdO family nonheme iron enzyme [Chitinilyticum aquatile]|uniref:SUMF1/EgtB/PvdO family nonheme iron enzyme n=1 Tax=Chitinilyticum aquatile TaxID=362520 RepID=UPI0006862D8D|nr:SUMF1/EgtB/PvdO family nonheme iron enzyme [Chitinilyticum aquatile]
MKRLALFVGIDQYDDQGITPLRCAARDARQLAAVFEHRLAFSTPVVLTEKELNAGRSVMRELRRIEGELSEGDLFVLFFAGHGKATESDQIFLLPSVSRRQLERGVTAGADVLSYKAIKAETEAWKGVQRVFIFDACRSPLPREEAENRDGHSDVHFAGEVIFRDPKLAASAQAEAVAPLVVLNSCQDQQKAEELENYEEGHGLFTAALLEELKARAAGSQSVILDDEFSQTLGKRMQQLARKYRQRETSQAPLLVGPQVRLYGPEASQNHQIRRLLDEFEAQLAAGQLERPVGECCRDTLTQLASQQYDVTARRELSGRLQLALDEQKKQGRLQRDEQRIEAARLLGTPEAFANYLSTCEECAHAGEARAAIAEARNAKDAEQASRNAEDDQAWLDIQNEADSLDDLEAKRALFQRYIDTWFKHRVAAKARVDELTEAIRQAEAERKRYAEDEAAWQAAQAELVASQGLAEQRAVYQRYAEQWQNHQREALAEIARLEQAIALAAEAEARRQADANAWQDTQQVVAATTDLQAQRTAYKQYVDKWENQRQQALAEVARLDEAIRQAAIAAADAAAWQVALASVDATEDMYAQREVYQAYADQWQAHRITALTEISKLDAAIQKAEKLAAQTQADEAAWQATLNAVAGAERQGKRAAYQAYAQEWQLHREQALAEIAKLDVVIRQAEEEAARMAADAAAWQTTLSGVAATADLEAQKRCYQSYADQWQERRDEALADIARLERAIAQAAAEHKAQVSADEAAWLKTQKAIATMSGLHEQRSAYQHYATSWLIHRDEALMHIAQLDRQIQQAQMAEEKAQERARADAAAWQSVETLLASTASLAEKRDACKHYANQWHNHRDEALSRIASFEQEIRQEQETAAARAAADEEAWRQACTGNNPDAYQCYLKECTEGQHVAEAQAKLLTFEQQQADEKAWQLASTDGGEAAYRSYLAQHPQGLYRGAAIGRLALFEERERAENSSWDTARGQNTASAYQRYLEHYPEGLHASEAAALLQQRELAARHWQEIVATATMTELDAFARQFPDAPEVAEAKARKAKLRTKKSYWLVLPAAGVLGLFFLFKSSPKPDGQAMEALESASAVVEAAQPLPFRDCEAGCPELVAMPSGTFQMGSPAEEVGRGNDEGPQTTVSFASGFAIATREVTFAEWDACVADGACRHQPDDEGMGRDQHPVINISFDDTKDYLGWLSRKAGKTYRLPSEAEWEYAARAGTTTPYQTGATISTAQAQFAADKAAKVGQFPPNAWGLYDMQGNVAEWVADCDTPDYQHAAATGQPQTGGDCSKRIIRGGGWSSTEQVLRLANRDRGETGQRMATVGFRVTRDQP